MGDTKKTPPRLKLVPKEKVMSLEELLNMDLKKPITITTKK